MVWRIARHSAAPFQGAELAAGVHVQAAGQGAQLAESEAGILGTDPGPCGKVLALGQLDRLAAGQDGGAAGRGGGCPWSRGQLSIEGGLLAGNFDRGNGNALGVVDGQGGQGWLTASTEPRFHSLATGWMFENFWLREGFFGLLESWVPMGMPLSSACPRHTL